MRSPTAVRVNEFETALARVSSDLLDLDRIAMRSDLVRLIRPDHRRRVDPRCSRRLLLHGTPADEALRVLAVRFVEHDLARGHDGVSAAVVHVDGMQQREADVILIELSRFAAVPSDVLLS